MIKGCPISTLFFDAIFKFYSQNCKPSFTCASQKSVSHDHKPPIFEYMHSRNQSLFVGHIVHLTGPASKWTCTCGKSIYFHQCLIFIHQSIHVIHCSTSNSHRVSGSHISTSIFSTITALNNASFSLSRCLHFLWNFNHWQGFHNSRCMKRFVMSMTVTWKRRFQITQQPNLVLH